jgi:uncharacterized membrane protein YfcA
MAGSAAGLPIGLAVFLSIHIDHLKLLAGLAVLFTLVFLLRSGAATGLAAGAAGAESTGAESVGGESIGGESPRAESFSAEPFSAESFNAVRPGMLEQISMGVVSGVMSGSLAMPGPVPAAWMSARSYGKKTIRATLLTLFIFSYLAALALQAIMAGIGKETLWNGLVLAVPTLAGVIIGRFLIDRLTERAFRWVLISVLTATTAGLFLNSIPKLVTG